MGKGLRCILFAWLCIASISFGDSWMKDQAALSLGHLMSNISRAGTTPGVVIASPSRGERREPDYFFHWVRDAGLVMSSVVALYATEKDAAKRWVYAQRLDEYVTLSRKNQLTPNPSDSLSSGRLGEPKFNVDGSAFTGIWGRPQNDGPALRSIALIRLANLWLDEGRQNDVRNRLYDSRLPADTVIKADLEFISHHWRETSFDIWEEISGQHLYTRLVHRRALVEGAKLADRMGDGNAADWYRRQIKPLEAAIETHWDARRGLLLPTLDRDGGVDYKTSDIDMAVLLAVIHAAGDDGYFSFSGGRVLSTMEKYINRFSMIYPVNFKGYGAVVLGRYPEDVYDGLTTSGSGNPWFLTTAAVAEIHYRLAEEIERRAAFSRDSLNGDFLDAVGAPARGVYTGPDKSDLVRRIHERGDAFLRRACFHGLPDGRLSEQMNRNTGFMQGARDLTWNYASYLTAYWHR